MNYEAIQKELSKKIITIDVKQAYKIGAGVDISYAKGSSRVVCCIICMNMDTQTVLETIMHEDVVEFPYIPGLLSFRELPIFLRAWQKVKTEVDIIFFDGNGILHPRGLGLASHASLEIGVPSVGVAKNPATQYEAPDKDRGSYSLIMNPNGDTIGAALTSVAGVKPIFVSTGNGVSLHTAINLTIKLVNSKDSRVPVITRMPDVLSREYIRNNYPGWSELV